MIANAARPRPFATGHARTVTGAVGSVLFGLLIGGLMLTFVATHFLGYRIATIQSFSMKPTLDRGDIIITRPASIDDAKAGDIIVFEEGTQQKLLVAHRVYNVLPVTTNITNTTTGEVTTGHTTLLRTKGDANASVDAQVVDASTFKGEVLLTIPSIGLLLDDVPLQAVFVAVFILTAGAWAAYEVVRRRRDRARGVPSADTRA
jgi:signal peptidase